MVGHSITQEDLKTWILIIVKEFHNVFSVCNQKTPLLVTTCTLVHVHQKTISHQHVSYFTHEKFKTYHICYFLVSRKI